MSKQSGLGDRLLVSGYNISGDVGSVQRVAGGNAPLVVTGIDKSAIERIGGRRDGGIEFSAFFNPATDQAHPVLSALPTADRIVSYLRGTGYESPAASCMAKQINYDPSRGQDGALTIAVQAQANAFGLEWGIQATDGIVTQATGAALTSLDNTADSDFGLQAYLHVVAFTGTSAAIKLEDSTDDAAWGDVTGGAFASVTAIGSERIATADNLTVDRYLRVITSGTFSNLEFVVVVVRNETAVTF